MKLLQKKTHSTICYTFHSLLVHFGQRLWISSTLVITEMKVRCLRWSVLSAHLAEFQLMSLHTVSISLSCSWCAISLTLSMLMLIFVSSPVNAIFLCAMKCKVRKIPHVIREKETRWRRINLNLTLFVWSLKFEFCRLFEERERWWENQFCSMRQASYLDGLSAKKKMITA